MPPKPALSHIDAANRPRMVDVGGKPATLRTAHAVAVVVLPPALALLLSDGEISTKKGPVFQTAILAGIMGAKRTSELIPLCHPLALSKAEVRIEPADDGSTLVRLDEPAFGVAPGQAAVFYAPDDRVLGGGWITS